MPEKKRHSEEWLMILVAAKCVCVCVCDVWCEVLFRIELFFLLFLSVFFFPFHSFSFLSFFFVHSWRRWQPLTYISHPLLPDHAPHLTVKPPLSSYPFAFERERERTFFAPFILPLLWPPVWWSCVLGYEFSTSSLTSLKLRAKE